MSGPFTTKVSDVILTMNRISRIDENTYQINSKSNPNSRSYIVDITNLNDHKGECMGFRYYGHCNHLKRLQKAGIKINLK